MIAPSVKLIKAGREFKACCPFHNEKTPSFTVNDEKGFYHCFGCGAHGDAIRFLTDQRGLPFMDAVKELAGKAGMEVPAPDPRDAGAAGAVGRAARGDGRGAAMVRRAAERGRGGEARAYLKQRGITEATKRSSAFGFAPDSRGKLKTALENFGEDKLVDGRPADPDRGERSSPTTGSAAG